MSNSASYANRITGKSMKEKTKVGEVADEA
jgi:hypothetical protein